MGVGRVARGGAPKRQRIGEAGRRGAGIFRVLGFEAEAEADGRYRAVAGDAYVVAIEFARPVRARALLGYGNASQPGSPHCGDQLELFVRQE